MGAKIEEKYYGIRIGDPRRHHCYLAVADGELVPLLFTSREKAVSALPAVGGTPDSTPRKVVRVKVRAY